MEKEKSFAIELHAFEANKNESFSVKVKAYDIFSAFEKAKDIVKKDNQNYTTFMGGSIDIID